MLLATDGAAGHTSARRFTVRISVDRRGLELDDAARAHLGTESFLEGGSLAIGPHLESPITGQRLVEWIFEQVRPGDQAGFWLLRCATNEWFRVQIDGDGAIVDSLGGQRGRIATLAHTFRNKLNTVRTNAELLALLTKRVGDSGLIRPCERIVRNVDAMAETFEAVVSSATRATGDDCNVIKEIRAIVGRTAWGDRIRIDGKFERKAPRGYCAAVAHLLLEWVSFDLAAGRDCTIAVGSSNAEALQFAASGIIGWLDSFSNRLAQVGQPSDVDLWPVPLLRDLGVGSGVWRAAGAGYASIGISS